MLLMPSALRDTRAPRQLVLSDDAEPTNVPRGAVVLPVLTRLTLPGLSAPAWPRMDDRRLGRGISFLVWYLIDQVITQRRYCRTHQFFLNQQNSNSFCHMPLYGGPGFWKAELLFQDHYDSGVHFLSTHAG